MNTGALFVPADVLKAAWLRERLFPGHTVKSVVPDGHEAYARIFHPARENGSYVRWETVAQRCGRTAHSAMQFHAIASPAAEAPDTAPSWTGGRPATGSLPHHLLSVLVDYLADYTDTPELAYFALWVGYGWHPSYSADAQVGSILSLNEREYYFFRGPLEAAKELGEDVGLVRFEQSPNIFWPDDHAWCVASEIDFDSTYVSGSEGLVEAILACPELESWRIQPDDLVTYDGDTVNR